MGGVRAYLGLGSNLGLREQNLAAAVKSLGRERSSAAHDQAQHSLSGRGPELQVLRASSIYATAPWGLETQPDFLNSVLEICTRLTPADLLSWVKTVEQDLGRRPAPPNGPRIIDVDILLYGGIVVNSPGLQIPHPRMHLRAFVLIPLAELDGSLVHPTLNTTIGDLAARVEGQQGVRLWGPPLKELAS